MSESIKYEVGQTWWYQAADKCPGSGEVTVTKVGRKYATLSNRGRVLLNSRHIVGDGLIFNGSLWTDRQEYTEHAEAQRLFSQLRNRMSYRTEASAENIRQAAGLLGVTL